MKIRYLLLVFLSSLFACQPGGNQLESEIAALEEQVESSNDMETAKTLIEKYQAIVEQNPDDAESGSRYLYRAAALQYRMNRFSASVDILKKAIKDYRSGTNTANNALLLGAIYEEKLRNLNSATTINQAFLSAFPEHEKAAEVKAKIPADAAVLDQRINNLGVEMFNDSTGRIEYKIANDYINSCELFAMMAPEDQNSPTFLHKAGETARSIRAYRKALDLYEWIGARYPNFEKAPQALFLRAFTLDNDLKRFDEAKALYESFLQKYPNDEFADDTKFLLDNLGKDDEEIIKSFTEKDQPEG